MEAETLELTDLLAAWRRGDRLAEEDLLGLVYRELRGIARRHLASERSGHTLQATELVHEAYLRMAGQKGIHWQNRSQFFAVAATMMRRILVDHARRRNASKRGAGVTCVTLEGAVEQAAPVALEVVALDDALKVLGRMDPFKASIVELRFFGGLSIEEAAQALECSTDTISRHWRSARAWLARELSAEVA